MEALLDDAWYQELIADAEPNFTEFVDFDGDGLEEVLIGFSSLEGNPGIYIGSYLPEEERWETLHYEEFDPISIMTDPVFEGTLTNEDETNMVVISVFTAGASSATEEIHILRMNEDQQIITAFSHENTRYMNGAYELKEDEKQLVVMNEHGIDYTLSLKGDFFTSEQGHEYRLFSGNPISKDEEWIALLNNSLFKYDIRLGDTIHEAKEKNPHITAEGPVEGGYKILFDDYAVYQDYFAYEADRPTVIDLITLYNLSAITLADIEKTLNIDIAYETFPSFYADNEISHVFEFEYEGYRYSGELEEPSKTSPIIEMSIR